VTESDFFILYNKFLVPEHKITSQNQTRTISPDSATFDIAPLILPKNQELGAIPNGA
jgi:hypothetical protein